MGDFLCVALAFGPVTVGRDSQLMDGYGWCRATESTGRVGSVW